MWEYDGVSHEGESTKAVWNEESLFYSSNVQDGA